MKGDSADLHGVVTAWSEVTGAVRLSLRVREPVPGITDHVVGWLR